MAININILGTGARTFAEHTALVETQNRANGGNFTTVVNNATTTLKTNAINKIESTVASEKTITPDKIITYTVKLDDGDKDTLENDLGLVRFCFWMKDKEKNDITLEVGTGKAAKADNTKRNAIKILNKKSLGTVGYKTDFLALKEGENLTENIAKHSYYYAVVNVNKEKKEVTLQIKFSKWLDTYKICVEAYLLGDTIKADGGKKAGVSGNTTASRTVKANPEIIASYWLNAAGKKIMHAGYKQDIYLYLKTLGLKDKEVKVNVYDKDYYPNPNQPTIYYGRTSKDDIIEWKNNTIKIDEREVLKQFKVGDKVRYKNASEDEDQEYKTAYDKIINNGDYLTEIDFSEKYELPLQLYVHFPDWKKLKLPNDNEYAKLTLTTKEQISDAFFAEVEKEEVQADSPKVKDKKGKTKLPKKAKVAYYKKIANGVLGQKVQLVAACANLEDKKVFFKIYEKEKLLVEKDTEIGVIQKGKEVTKIEATVQNGYAVAEIELKHCKEDADNEDWEKILDPEKGDLKKSKLYIKVEITEQVFTVKNKGVFLKEEPFKMSGTTVIQDIYHDGKIGKVEYQQGNAKMKKVKFVYHDSSKKKHELGKFDITWAQKWVKGSRYYSKGSKKVISAGITKYYTYGKGETPLVTPFTGTKKNKKFSYTNGSLKIIVSEDTTREYFNPERLATIFGTLAETGFEDVVCNGSVSTDGTGAYSVTHVNGYNIDFKYLRTDNKRGNIDKNAKNILIPRILVGSELLDIKRQNEFMDALYKFGWSKTEKSLAHKTHENKDLNHCKPKSDHKNHLHIQGFKANYKK
ncbi:hypothetical protein [Tenacibaculum ovolyticum]|uniref:hypothetical protein n=1 Tax=Tenacibaculum ovolyticum TaxID=104270 RepID=UPI003BAA0DCD